MAVCHCVSEYFIKDLLGFVFVFHLRLHADDVVNDNDDSSSSNFASI